MSHYFVVDIRLDITFLKVRIICPPSLPLNMLKSENTFYLVCIVHRLCIFDVEDKTVSKGCFVVVW